MKKLFCTILAVLMVLSLSGCNKDKPEDPTPTPKPDPVVEKTDKEKLIEGLSSVLQYVTSKEPGSHFLRVSAQEETLMIGIYCAGGSPAGKISEVQLLENNRYQVKVDYEAFAGNDLQDGYEAYSEVYFITYDGTEKIILELPAEYQSPALIMYADNGLALNELLTVLSSHGTYKEESNCFDFNTDGTYTRWMEATEYFESGNITNLVYEGFDQYRLTVEFPGRAATEEFDEIKPYTLTAFITLYNEYKSMSLEETVGENMNWFNLTAVGKN